MIPFRHFIETPRGLFSVPPGLAAALRSGRIRKTESVERALAIAPGVEDWSEVIPAPDQKDRGA